MLEQENLPDDPDFREGQAGPGTEVQEDAQPYTAPVPGGAIACIFCGHSKFRRSRVLFSDLREMLLLRYPVRCMRCHQRQHGYLLTAALAHASKSPSTNVARGADTWQAWTGDRQDAQPLRRPMTTSIGTRATKLQPLPRAATPRNRTPPPPRDDDRQIW